MANPARLTGSGPLARLSTIHRPGCGGRSPSFRTPCTGDVPIFLMLPIAFSTSVVMPPALLPGVGFTASIGCPCARRNSARSSSTMPRICSPASRLTARDATMCSQPGMPGTSDMSTEPPAAITRSVMAPITVFPAMAVVQSEPPHCTPTTSPDKGQGWRSRSSAARCISRTSSQPLASASTEPPSS